MGAKMFNYIAGDDGARDEAALEHKAGYLGIALGTLEAVRNVISDYHHALDKRQHGDIAAFKALDRIQTILGKPWVQGEELERRKKQTP